MNLTSSILKVDLAVLAIILSLLFAIWDKVKKIQNNAVQAAEERTETNKTLEFHDRRLTNVENWISGNSGLRVK